MEAILWSLFHNLFGITLTCWTGVQQVCIMFNLATVLAFHVWVLLFCLSCYKNCTFSIIDVLMEITEKKIHYETLVCGVKPGVDFIWLC
jgi:hypothetical protein